MQNPSASYRKTLFLARFAMLLAIEAIFCFTPLGSIPIPPLVATTAMVPVVITAILMGPWAGSAMGLFAGIFSFIVWTFMPPNAVTAFIFTPTVSHSFWSVLICFVPRILAGTVAGLLFKALRAKCNINNPVHYAASGVAGSLVNTFGVLGGTYLVFYDRYADVLKSAYHLTKISQQVVLGVIGTTVLTNGIPEAVLAAVAAYAVCRPLLRHFK